MNRNNAVEVTVVIGEWDDWPKVLSDLEEYFQAIVHVETLFLRPKFQDIVGTHQLVADLIAASRIHDIEIRERTHENLVVRLGSTLEPVYRIRKLLKDNTLNEHDRIRAAHSLVLAETIARETYFVPDVIFCRGADSHLEMKLAYQSLGLTGQAPKFVLVPEEQSAAAMTILDYIETLVVGEDK